jgi:phage-related protein
MKQYEIAFYSQAVQDEILNWPTGINASFTRIAEMMVKHGLTIGMPYIKPMGSGLFEIRAKGKEGIGRALFCTLVNQRIVILHGFIKKTQQTPSSEIKTARKRLSEVKYAN